MSPWQTGLYGVACYLVGMALGKLIHNCPEYSVKVEIPQGQSPRYQLQRGMVFGQVLLLKGDTVVRMTSDSTWEWIIDSIGDHRIEYYPN